MGLLISRCLLLLGINTEEETKAPQETGINTDEAGSSSSLAARWREMQGLPHWEGLLDPLDPDLRKSLLFYGDFNQAVYDAFDNEAHSKYTGSCRFSKEEFFREVGMVKGRSPYGQYHVSRYFYATSTAGKLLGLLLESYSKEGWSKESNWMGYVAVSGEEATRALGRRDIVIVWRGTLRPFEWVDDFDFRQADIDPLLPAGQTLPDHADKPSVESGWLTIYTATDAKSPFTSHSARDQVLNEVRSLMNKYKNEDVTVTVLGHSLGAALAIVNAFDIALNGINVREGKEVSLVTAIVFGCPGVGDEAFNKKCEELPGLRILRVRNKADIINQVPGWLMGYRDVGEELLFDSRLSPYLKKTEWKSRKWCCFSLSTALVIGTTLRYICTW